MTLSTLAALAISLVPFMVGLILLRGKVGFEVFTAGAREGLQTALHLVPTLVALVVAIRMLNACGLLAWLGNWLAPLCRRIGLPTEILPLLVTRPFSGSAATAAYSQLLADAGPDSFAALCASVIMGSSDTVVYIISVYMSSLGLKKSRHAYPCALLVMLFCIFFSCVVCRLWFKSP